MPDVTIPADVAKQYADDLRKFGPQFTKAHALADLLDPRPATLREQVLRALDRLSFGPDDDNPWGLLHADAVLSVVADWLAAQPVTHQGYGEETLQRAADVALIRGGAAPIRVAAPMPSIPTTREGGGAE